MFESSDQTHELHFDYTFVTCVECTLIADSITAVLFVGEFVASNSATLPAAGMARVALYDVRGARVVELFRGEATAGAHRLTWDAKDAGRRPVADGVYFARVEALGQVATRRVAVVETASP
jgi:flagellar hook assembly protein FlgD